jgi:flagellar basal body P-ring formation protein FlgA
MKKIIFNVIVVLSFILPATGRADIGQEHFTLQIDLPSEIAISNNIPTLGQIAAISGNEALAGAAGKIELGYISLPGQKIVIDRNIILSRLASSGIPSSCVTITGAEKTIVGQQNQIIKASEFADAASAFLKKNFPDCQFETASFPKDLILSVNNKDIRLSASLIKTSMKDQAKVRVAAFSNDTEIDSREIIFNLKYKCRRLVAQVDISPGEIINEKNTKVEIITFNSPGSFDTALPYGFIAKRLLRANSVISPDMTGPAELPVLLKRDQTVTIKFEKLGLLVTAAGMALQDGRVNECIKIKNIDSQRIIAAKVNPDGTVEPVF